MSGDCQCVSCTAERNLIAEAVYAALRQQLANQEAQLAQIKAQLDRIEAKIDLLLITQGVSGTLPPLKGVDPPA